MSVEAAAQNSTVTVFVYSSPEWPMDDGLTSQWDDTSLVITTPAEPPTGTAPPPPPTSPPGTPLPPLATSTPHPDGSVIHTIRSGETIWAIAIQYATGANITPEEMLAQIKQLNNDPTIIYPGQDLVIAVPGDSKLVALAASEGESESAAPAAGGEGESAATTAGGGEQVSAATTARIEQPAVAEIAASSSTLCVSAYHDRNSDGMRDPTTEELLADAGFTLSNEQGVVGSYTSDGENEPYCFAQIIPGTYMVQLAKPSGYNTTTPEYWAVPLPAGATANVEFGHQRDPSAPASEGQSLAAAPESGQPSSPEELLQAAQNRSSESESESESKSLLSSLGEIAIGVSGIFVLLLAGAVGVAFVASRRRA
jgi:LysM repeat protein